MLAACISQCFHVKPLCSGRVVIARFRNVMAPGFAAYLEQPLAALFPSAPYPFSSELGRCMHGCAAAFLRGHRSISTCASLACNCNAKVPERHHMGTQRPHAECRAMKLYTLSRPR